MSNDDHYQVSLTGNDPQEALLSFTLPAAPNSLAMSVDIVRKDRFRHGFNVSDFIVTIKYSDYILVPYPTLRPLCNTNPELVVPEEQKDPESTNTRTCR